jgi:hypothetical protein
VSAFLFGRACFGVLTFGISSYTLVAYRASSIALSSWLKLAYMSLIVVFKSITFVFRPRQAAQASKTRCLFGGSDGASARGAVDGSRDRRRGRVISFGHVDVGSIFVVISLGMVLQRLSEKFGYLTPSPII